LALLALVPSLFLLWDGFESLRVTDADIAGGAPEDTLGFGVVPFLFAFGTPAVLLLSWAWWRGRQGFPRSLALAETFLFIVSLAFNIASYIALRHRVLG